MILKAVDSINSIIQCCMFILISNYCIEHQKKHTLAKTTVYIIVLLTIVQLTTMFVGNSSIGAIFIHTTMIVSGAIVYKRDFLGAAISFSIIYLSIILNMLIFSNLFFLYFEYKISGEYLSVAFIIFIYFPQFLMSYFILSNKEVIYKVYLSIKSKNISTILIIVITIIADFIMSFNAIIHNLDNPVFEQVVFLLLSIFIIGITIYFINIESNLKKVELLNKSLEEKISELKKIKHDYGSQISYLYGLYLMEQQDRIGEFLKNIIDGYKNTTSEVKLDVKDTTLIKLIVNSIDHKGISIKVDEMVPLDEIALSENEIQRIISNILINAVTAMNRKGIININTYYCENNVIIKIQNNGPKIDECILEKIFDEGFTTKDNKDKDNGFGLAIVKELVEKNNGSISVYSSLELTEFIIKLNRISSKDKLIN